MHNASFSHSFIVQKKNVWGGWGSLGWLLRPAKRRATQVI